MVPAVPSGTVFLSLDSFACFGSCTFFVGLSFSRYTRPSSGSALSFVSHQHALNEKHTEAIEQRILRRSTMRETRPMFPSSQVDVFQISSVQYSLQHTRLLGGLWMYVSFQKSTAYPGASSLSDSVFCVCRGVRRLSGANGVSVGA